MPKPFFENWCSVKIEAFTRCNAVCGKDAKLQQHSDSKVKIVYDCFLRGLRVAGNSRCLGWRNGDHYDFWTFAQVHERIRATAKAMRQKAKLPRGSRVGIYSVNSPQWMITAMACASSSYAVVPLYDTLGADTCTFIIKDVAMSLLFVDTTAAAVRVLESLQHDSVAKSTLKTIITLGSIGCFTGELISAEHTEEAQRKFGIKLVNIVDFISGLVEDDAYGYLPEPEDLYMIQYTSGTTGVPKGVMLTHGQFVSNIAAIDSLYKYAAVDANFDTSTIIFHYLPLAHSYGQLLAVKGLYLGVGVGIFSGNVQKLADDAQILRPTYMPLVPRIMNKVYSKVMAELDTKGAIAKKIFRLAYNRKRKLLRKGILTKTSIWDILVFRKLQAKLGGRVQWMLTASAPVSPEVLEFWRVAFGTHLFEAYGQTECTALVSIAVDPDGGNVGHPVCCNMIKLVDVPELDYFTKDNKGEVCVKGPNVMKGYYKRPDLTAEVIDDDGWLHTGDIGEFLSDGSLKIIDRKKHIFKLAQGEYIAPEKIESVYACCPLVAQVYVDGNSLQWFTVAIVVPEPLEAEIWAKQHNIKFDIVQLCQNNKFIEHVFSNLLALGREKGLNKLEQIRGVCLHPELFTITDGLLTPSMKNRRPQLRVRFHNQIQKLYDDGPMEEKLEN